MTKKRVDVLLVERGLVESREKARALVMSGVVYSGEVRVEKAGTGIAEDAPLEVRGETNPFVSRGGLKLEGALRAFGFDANGRIVADIGASTGGFTDCVLQRGAARVYAVDVGYGQLHGKLRSDPRVTVLERVNARHLDARSLPEPVNLVVVDASFIGLGKLLPAIALITAEGGDVVALVKPQFEVGRDLVGKGGVVRDADVRRAAIENVKAEALTLGFVLRGECDSEVPGPKGNLEAFLWLQKISTKPTKSQ